MSAVPQQDKSVIELPPDSYSKRDLPDVHRPQPTTLVQALAAAASDPRTDMDKMERLFAMHQTMLKQQAEAAFNDAMSRAQAKILPVANNALNEHTRSRYAKLAAINKAITPIYTAEGLAVSFDSYKPEFDKDGKEINQPEQGWHRIIAIVSHKEGHSRRYHLDLPLDDAGAKGAVNKTGVQAMGSTTSYGRRYLVCMIFNVATEDDNDGSGGEGGRMGESALADHLAAIDAASDTESLKAAFGAAWKTAETAKDKHAMRLLTEHKDRRKKALGGRS